MSEFSIYFTQKSCRGKERLRGGEILYFSKKSYYFSPNFSPDAEKFDYVKDEVGFRLADRLFDIKRDFKYGVDLGGGRGYLTKHILAETAENIKLFDISPTMLEQAESTPGVNLEKILLDKEYLDVSFHFNQFKHSNHKFEFEF